MTDTCTPGTLTPLPPVPPRPETDAAAVRAIEEASVLALLDNFASKDMPGKQDKIQNCVNEILATVKPRPAAN